MTLRELIEMLEAMDPNMVVRPGFGPGHSWRGVYSEIAFTPLEESTVGAMLAEARKMDGAELHGWKGGTYCATLDTDCNVAADGDYGGDTDRMGVWWATNMLNAPLRAEVERLTEENLQWQDSHTALKLDFQKVEAERDQQAREAAALREDLGKASKEILVSRERWAEAAVNLASVAMKAEEDAANLRRLLSMVTDDEMGGTPDLFGPKCGWDAWFELVRAALP